MELEPNCYRIENKTYQGRRNGFQSGGGRGTCNTRKYFWSSWFAAKKNLWILDVLQWLKQHSNSFYSEALSFLSFVSLSSFCYAKKLGAMPHYPPPFLGVVGPDYIPKGQHGIEFWRPWNAKMKYTNGYSSKSRWEKRSHFMFTLGVLWWSLKCQKWYIFCIFYG